MRNEKLLLTILLNGSVVCWHCCGLSCGQVKLVLFFMKKFARKIHQVVIILNALKLYHLTASAFLLLSAGFRETSHKHNKLPGSRQLSAVLCQGFSAVIACGKTSCLETSHRIFHRAFIFPPEKIFQLLIAGCSQLVSSFACDYF